MNYLFYCLGLPPLFRKSRCAPNAQSSGSGCPLQFTLSKNASAKIQKGASSGRSFCISLSRFCLRFISTHIPKPSQHLHNLPRIHESTVQRIHESRIHWSTNPRITVQRITNPRITVQRIHKSRITNPRLKKLQNFASFQTPKYLPNRLYGLWKNKCRQSISR